MLEDKPPKNLFRKFILPTQWLRAQRLTDFSNKRKWNVNMSKNKAQKENRENVKEKRFCGCCYCAKKITRKSYPQFWWMSWLQVELQRLHDRNIEWRDTKRARGLEYLRSWSRSHEEIFVKVAFIRSGVRTQIIETSLRLPSILTDEFHFKWLEIYNLSRKTRITCRLITGKPGKILFDRIRWPGSGFRIDHGLLLTCYERATFHDHTYKVYRRQTNLHDEKFLWIWKKTVVKTHNSVSYNFSPSNHPHSACCSIW